MIEFVNVSKTYDNGTKALNNVNLKIDEGEFVFVVGASGAGKSTFLKLIMREESTTEGKVIVNGYDLTKIKKKDIPYMRRTMGIVFQDFRLIPKMTVYDNVAFPMRIIGCGEKKIRKRVNFVLHLVNLQHKADCYPNELSGGERQRVGLARALVNNPPMIIADEPTGNIDPEMSYELTELLNQINQNGTTVVMVTHEHELVRQFNKRVVVIKDGTIQSDTDSSACEYTEEKNYEEIAAAKAEPEPEPEPEIIDDFDTSEVFADISSRVDAINTSITECAETISESAVERADVDDDFPTLSDDAQALKEKFEAILGATDGTEE
ncbi:MAG: cell division ATP-binding protein FtsE [Clostridia bacterium]|nr:cell division ATP-binding protein FtsE [Clostridia bacterium]